LFCASGILKKEQKNPISYESAKNTNLDPVELATYVANSEATKTAMPYVRETEKNGIKLIIMEGLNVVIKNSAGKTLWKSDKGNETEIYEEQLSENGKYALVQYGLSGEKVVYIETTTGKIHEYIPPKLPHSHDVWLSFGISDDGLAKAYRNEIKDKVKKVSEIYEYDFLSDRVNDVVPSAKTRGYIYYKADAGKVLKEYAASLKENRIFKLEGIAVLESPKGQKDNWVFIDGKVMIVPHGGNDDVFEQALDFFGVDYDKYGLIR
jgi:hypothetical protein